jgi:hypothetical protein
VRTDAGAWLSNSLLEWDASFLEDDDILSLIPPTRLIQTINDLRESLFEELEREVSRIVSEIDFDTSAEDHFYELNKTVAKIERAVLGTDDEDSEEVSRINEAIAHGIEEIEEAQAQQKEDEESEEWMMREFEARQSRRPSTPSAVAPSTPGIRGARSIFSDVEE